MSFTVCLLLGWYIKPGNFYYKEVAGYHKVSFIEMVSTTVKEIYGKESLNPESSNT